MTEVLETAVAGSQAGDFLLGGNFYRIFIQLQDAEKRSLNEILDLILATGRVEQVTLRNLVLTEASRGPILIDRRDQRSPLVWGQNPADFLNMVFQLSGRPPRT